MGIGKVIYTNTKARPITILGKACGMNVSVSNNCLPGTRVRTTIQDVTETITRVAVAVMKDTAIVFLKAKSTSGKVHVFAYAAKVAFLRAFNEGML